MTCSMEANEHMTLVSCIINGDFVVHHFSFVKEIAPGKRIINGWVLVLVKLVGVSYVNRFCVHLLRKRNFAT